VLLTHPMFSKHRMCFPTTNLFYYNSKPEAERAMSSRAKKSYFLEKYYFSMVKIVARFKPPIFWNPWRFSGAKLG